MREILFRGKQSDNEWVKGYLYITQGGQYEISRYSKSYDCERYTSVVIPETVGQYAGLTDKNGTKIFEGDIVEITFHSDAKYQYLIWFNKEMSCWEAIETKDIRFNGNDYYGNNVEYSDFCFMLQDPYGDVESVKIIGNLHDNPELLRGDTNA